MKLTLTPTKNQIAPRIQPTESQGTTVFVLPHEVLNTTGTVDVSAANYISYTQQVDISATDTSAVILLKQLPAAPPPPQTPHLEPYTSTKTSGPVPSGSGSGKLEYTIESDAPRDGYGITSASYSLSGDRAPCGQWSWCWWKQNDQTKAIFAFQLQGHSEWPSPGVSLTAGTLTVNYGPK